VSAAVFALVPAALIGGIAGLVLRGMSFSLPAAVGFIALAGVAVLNGVVMATEVRGALERGLRLEQAIIDGAAHSRARCSPPPPSPRLGSCPWRSTPAQAQRSSGPWRRW
jgi:Cu/Ag efflux pump CusA